MPKKNKLKLNELVVQSFMTDIAPRSRGGARVVAAITPNCETNNNPRCVSPLCMTVPTPCTEGGPPCIDQIGIAGLN